MKKGCYISLPVAIVAAILSAGAIATIIALSVVYVQEKTKSYPVPFNDPWDKYRLPKSLVPESYNVTLWPRLTPNDTTGLYIFTGKVLCI